MKTKKKHWINNGLAQACLVAWLGSSVVCSAITGEVGYMFVMPTSLAVGILLTTFTPKEA